MRAIESLVGSDRGRCHPVPALSTTFKDQVEGNASVAPLVLRLYIAGNSASSRRAEQNLQQLYDLMSGKGWKVEVINVLDQPDLAEQAGIIATPTLSYEDADRSRRIVGDLSDTRRVLEFLGIDLEGKTA